MENDRNKLELFKHDYQPLPQNVASAIQPIYEDLSNFNLLEKCDGGFTQNNNESYNQLIWKISSKIIPSGFKIVEIAAYIAACLFNEDASSLLYMMNAMGVTFGPSFHLYAQKKDVNRISISEQRAHESTREGRMVRRQHQIQLLEAALGIDTCNN